MKKEKRSFLGKQSDQSEKRSDYLEKQSDRPEKRSGPELESVSKEPSFSEKASVSEIKEDSRVQKMRQFIQHGRVNTYDHCCSVASLSSRINRRLRLHADEKTLLKGAMLHDYYLYDWHEEDDGTHHWHGFTHPEKAARNAGRDFNIDARTEHVIQSHMWPLTLRHIPRSREAWIVCLADKYVSLRETLFQR